MQTSIRTWFDAQGGFGAFQLSTIAPVAFIFAIAAAVAAVITVVSGIQTGLIG